MIDSKRHKDTSYKAVWNWFRYFIKYFIPGMILVSLFLYLAFFVLFPLIESTSIQKKREMIQNQVSIVYSIVNHYHTRSQQGKLSEEEAKKTAMETVRVLRYGADKRDYFWINDMNGVMLMHPYRPNLENRNLLEMQDKGGKKLFREFVNVAKMKGDGFVDYYWQHNDDASFITKKISYISRFEPWDWVIGTGVYIEDVKAELSILTSKILSYLYFSIFMTIAISLFTSIQTLRLQKRRDEYQEQIIEMEQWYRAILLHIDEGIVVCNLSEQILFMNAKAKSLLGVNEQDTGDKKLNDLFSITTNEGDKTVVLPVGEMKTVERKYIVARRKTSRGDLSYLAFNLARLDADLFGTEMVIIAISNVTNQTSVMLETEEYAKQLDSIIESRTEQLVKANNDLKLAQLAINSAADGISFIDATGSVISANDAEETILGIPTETIVGSIHPAIQQALSTEESIASSLSNSSVWRGSITYKQKDKEDKPLELTLTPIPKRIGDRQTFMLIEKDVTEKRRQEESLYRLKAAFEQSLDGVAILDMEMKILFANQAWAVLHNQQSDSLIGQDYRSFHTDEENESEMCVFFDELHKKGNATGEITLRGQDGHDIPTSSTATIIYNSEMKPSAILVITKDVREQKEYEAALKQSELKFRSLFDYSSDAIFILEDGQIVDCNNKSLEMFRVDSHESMLEYSVEDLSFPYQIGEEPASIKKTEHIEAAIRNGNESFEWSHRRTNGEVFQADVHLSPIRIGDRVFVQGVIRDLTEKHRMEMELRQAQKLESIGQLAAGIAHEINTPIQFIGDSIFYLEDACKDVTNLVARYKGLLGNVDDAEERKAIRELEEEIDEDCDLEFHTEETPNAFERIKRGTDRVTAIVRAMKEFAHPDSSEMEFSDLNRLIETTVTVATNEFKYVAELKLELNEVPQVYCHRGEINQVLINLIVNAAHSIKDKSETSDGMGLIRIRTEEIDGFVQVLISDTGMGIPEGIQERIFDPFFTTKKVGVGSGQGLAISRNLIVEKHKGKLFFTTKKNEGTTFHIHLPLEKSP